VDKESWMGKLSLPLTSSLSNSSIESHFCLALPSPEFLENWCNTSLHPAELNEYEDLKNTRRKHDYLLRNYCAKKVILSCLKKPTNYAAHLHLDKNTMSQLILTSNRFYYFQLQVNVTHSEILGFALAYEGLYPLGIDIEQVNTQKTQAMENNITSHENNLVKSCLLNSDIVLISLWTAKEAICKALGGGLDVFSGVLEIYTIIPFESYIELHFVYFPGYRAYSFFLKDYILTIAFPYSKRLRLDINKIWHDLNLDRQPFPKKYEGINK